MMQDFHKMSIRRPSITRRTHLLRDCPELYISRPISEDQYENTLGSIVPEKAEVPVVSGWDQSRVVASIDKTTFFASLNAGGEAALS